MTRASVCIHEIMNVHPWLAQPNLKSVVVTCSVAATASATAAAASSDDVDGSLRGGSGVCPSSVFFISTNLSIPLFELLLPIAMSLFSLLVLLLLLLSLSLLYP